MKYEDKKQNKQTVQIRTDLAVEEQERFPGDGGEVQGVSLRKWRESDSDIRMTEVKILNEQGARIMGKTMGTYLTLEADLLAKKDESYHEEVSKELAGDLQKLLRSLTGKMETELKILAVGLGNSQVTPDALGPKVIHNLQMTRHLTGYGKVGNQEDQNGKHHERKKQDEKEQDEKEYRFPSLSGIVPGVMAQTGMETAEILKGIIQETKPDLLLAIDALAARSIRRLGTTIQLTDTGIHPGSGVGNHRRGLTKESLGIPVLAIGVPTVVSAAAIVYDTVDVMAEALKKSRRTEHIGGFVEELEPEEQYLLIRELLTPEFGNLYVTPPDIDERIQYLSYTISEGIHKALFGVTDIAREA